MYGFLVTTPAESTGDVAVSWCSGGCPVAQELAGWPVPLLGGWRNALVVPDIG